MEDVQKLREYTRLLERKLNLINSKECGCCCGINIVQCHMLVEIGRHRDMSLKEVASVVEVDKSVASRMADSLVKKGLIEREQSKEDRRWITLNLTKEGEDLYQKIEQDMNQKFDLLLNKIPKSNRANVIEALELYIEAFNQLESEEG